MENFNKESLMIGDWVYNTRDNHPERVREIWEHRVMLEYSDLYEYNEIEPIPLTPEILEKNGYKKHGFKDIEGQHQWTLWIDTISYISLWCRELNDEPKDGWMVSIEHPLLSCCRKVESVHELQHTLRCFDVKIDIKL